MKRFRGSRRSFLIRVAIVLVAAVGLGLYHSHSSSSTTQQNANRPRYLSFTGNYIFAIPDNNIVDEHAITGVQLVYAGSLNAKTLDDVYSASAITVQPMTFLNDHSSKAFKNYVNTTFVSDVKKNISSDLTIKFDKVDGWDAAKVSVKKNGQMVRFAYLKNGQHPVTVVSKDETTALKKIEQTLSDAEGTNLKSDIAPLKQAVLSTAELIKAQKAHDIYQAATPSLRTKSTEVDLTNALGAIKEYTLGHMTIDGGSFSNNSEFTAVVSFEPLNKDLKPAYGAMYITKLSGQWKLQALTLPSPR